MYDLYDSRCLEKRHILTQLHPHNCERMHLRQVVAQQRRTGKWAGLVSDYPRRAQWPSQR